MTNRLQTLVPAMFQPNDPAAGDPALQLAHARKLSAFAAVSSAVLLVTLIAVLMGMS
jgi:hypothetical protein